MLKGLARTLRLLIHSPSAIRSWSSSSLSSSTYHLVTQDNTLAVRQNTSQSSAINIFGIHIEHLNTTSVLLPTPFRTYITFLPIPYITLHSNTNRHVFNQTWHIRLDLVFAVTPTAMDDHPPQANDADEMP